jgi:hypothetical protein
VHGYPQLVSDKTLVVWNKQAMERATRFRKSWLKIVDLLSQVEIKKQLSQTNSTFVRPSLCTYIWQKDSHGTVGAGKSIASAWFQYCIFRDDSDAEDKRQDVRRSWIGRIKPRPM